MRGIINSEQVMCVSDCEQVGGGVGSGASEVTNLWQYAYHNYNYAFLILRALYLFLRAIYTDSDINIINF